MDKNTKLILDIIGILISIAGILILFTKEQYVAATVLILVSTGLLIYGIKISRTKAIQYCAVRIRADILDDKGHKSLLVKEKELIVSAKNVTTIFDRNLTSTGKFEFLDTNIGELLPPVDEGGSLALATIFKTPLEKKKRIKHVLRTNVWDGFTESRETFSYMVSDPIREELTINLNFPKNRPCKSCSVYMFCSGDAVQLDAPNISNKRCSVQFFTKTPRFGAKYVMEWEW